MGSIQNESPVPHSVPGHIFLQSSVLGQFDSTLAATSHSSADAFLEHLLELYIKTERQIQSVKVRSDLAQRFMALQCRTQHQSSDGLMKKLLELHLMHQNNPPPSNTAASIPSQGRTEDARESFTPRPECQLGAPSQGRKSRKSKPKRNVRHTSLLDTDDDSVGPSTAAGGRNASSASWREMSVSSLEDTEVSNRDTSDMDTNFDLKKVKQEVEERGDDLVKAKQNDKDSRSETDPLCLSLQKPISARDAARILQRDVLPTEVTKPLHHLYSQHNSHSSIAKPNPKTARQFMQANWRSQSEPAGYDVSERQHRDPLSLQASPQAYFKEATKASMMKLGLKQEDMMTMLDTGNRSDMKSDVYNTSHTADEAKNGYNYVLVDDHHSNSLPPSPMHQSKSNAYTLSSDEEEPEDLSMSGSSSYSSKPQNLSVSKPRGSPTDKHHDTIKYDSNANALAYPVAQLNGQLIAQTQIPVPQNLLFHSLNSAAKTPLMQIAPKSIAQQVFSGSITPTSMTNQHVMLMSNSQQPPPLQLVTNMRSLPPPLLQPGLVSPNNGPQILVPLNSMMSPLGPQGPPTPNTPNSNSDDNPDSPNSRKKRKKMEDTTVFRDPPEQSLPFNGPNKYRFYCDVCDTGFTRRYTFNRHKCKGRVEKHYCQLCDKAYLSKYKLKDHILVKHEGQTVSCPECGKRFSSRSSMEMHKKQQHEGQYSIFCKICGKGFNHTGHYYGHMNKHTNTKPFWCQQCGKRFYGSSYLHNHKQVCRGNNDLNYACTVCDRKFKCELYLKKHMKIHDNTPIIDNPNVAKPSDEDLTKAGVRVADISRLQAEMEMMNGEPFQLTRPIFPNGPDYSDSNSNSTGALVIDEPGKLGREGNNNVEDMKEESIDMSMV